MKKMFLFMMISADGYFEGPKHQLDWHNVDSEFVDFALKQLDEVDTLVFGRRTYQLMYEFWPSETAKKADPLTAKAMNSLDKIVFSRTLKSVDWQNTKLIKSNLKETIKELKSRPGKDIGVLGSSNLCLSLIEDQLLDEIRLMVNPIVLGQGTTLFDGLKKPLKLKLSSQRAFNSGNVLLTYKPVY